MLPDLNRLKVFFHVYSLKSINGAAKHLHITQPGVSQHIAKLESEIGTPLFVRLHKKIVPTLAGNRLFGLVAPFMDTLNRELESISIPMEEPHGLIRIGAPLEFGKAYLPAICHRFRRQYPNVRFQIRLNEPHILLEAISSGDLDIALVDYFSEQDQLPGTRNQFTIDPLLAEELVLACSGDYYDERIQGDTSLGHLLAQDYISDEEDPVILRHWFWHYFKTDAPRFNIVMTIESHQGLLAGIRCGMGLGITASHLVRDAAQDGEIVPIFPGKDPVISQISLVWLAGKKLTRTEAVFLDLFKREVQQKIGLKSVGG